MPTQQQKLLLKVVALVLSFAITHEGPSAVAQSLSVNGYLINTRELKDLAGPKLTSASAKISNYYIKHQQLEKAFLFNRFNSTYLNESDPVCAFIGHGCLTVAYTDPSTMIHWHGPAGFSSSVGDTLEMTEQTETGVLPDLNGQLEIREFLEVEGKLLNVDLINKAQNASYFNFDDLRRKDEAAINQGFVNFVKGALSEDAFTELVLKHPRGFTVLSDLHTDLIAKFKVVKIRPPYFKSFENVISKALLLTVNALWVAADAHLDTYPYTDGTVIFRDQLNLKAMFKALKNSDPKKDRWPKISALNPEIRQQAQGSFIKKTEKGDKWRVKGSFNSIANVIWIDFDQPFYESVYVLYHELFHVLHHYSLQQAASLNDLQAWLNENLWPQTESGIDQPAVRFTLLLTKNELGAIINQAKLFHSIGALTTLWQGSALSSAQAWHDYLYFGGQKSLTAETQSTTPSGLCPAERAYIANKDRAALAQNKTVCPIRLWYANGSLEFHPDSVIPAPIYEQFFSRFDLIYFGGIYSSSAYQSNGQSIDNLEFDFATPPARLRLTCAQLAEVRTSFSRLSHWTFGIPVPYEIENYKVENLTCKSLGAVTGHLPSGYFGAEGSHTGDDGNLGAEGSHTDDDGNLGAEGSHTDIDANPAVDGAPDIDGTDLPPRRAQRP